VFTTSGTYLLSFVTQIFHNGHSSHGGDRKTFVLMASTQPIGTLGAAASLLAAMYVLVTKFQILRFFSQM